VIRAEGLGKKYVIGHAAEREGYVALRDVLARGVRNFWRKTTGTVRGRAILAGDTVEEFWALKDVNFEVRRGEVLGIIGRNGAGKSTLLKILSRITEPSEGRVTINGRVASLLEVGTGFHPELTGRENIYLNGAILGMTRAEIRRKFDEIVAFAEVEKFLDTPVKRYSSGMYVRLAFAVAAHLEPEILVVDEVLAVGDAEFQKKCLGKMDEVSRREGRTVLIVSHNLSVIKSLCAWTLWLDGGRLRDCGAPDMVVGAYLAQSTGGPDEGRIVPLYDRRRPVYIEDSRLRVDAVEWLTPLPLQHGNRVELRVHFKTRAPLYDVSAGIGFNAVEGSRVVTYLPYSKAMRQNIPLPGTYFVDLAIDGFCLGPDTYNLEVGFRSGNYHNLDFLPACAQLQVIPGPNSPAGMEERAPGVRFEGDWSWVSSMQLSELDVAS